MERTIKAVKRCVIASDSFKGSLSSLQVAESVQKGIHSVFPECEVVMVCVADGGEGTVDALLGTLGGRKVLLEVHDPVGRLITASYVILDDGITAVLEMSSASGLPLLKDNERNPMLTSTYGTGEIIADALRRGCRKFLIGIGGSATNDAGMGMLSALGYRFLDNEGSPLEGKGESLAKVCSIDDSSVEKYLLESEFIIACDVDSPFCGLNGAAYVYGSQKGATPEMIEELDTGMKHFAEQIDRKYGVMINDVPGAGAAGGMGGAFVAFLNGSLRRGADLVLDAIGFDELIKGADLVITGEGRLDSQTNMGKLPYIVASRARRMGVKVFAICGQADISESPIFDRIIQTTPPDMPLEMAMRPEVASDNIMNLAESLLDEFNSF